GMNRTISGLVALTLGCGSIVAQKTASGMTIANLATPKYPPLALAARVTGDVSLDVRLASDGSTRVVTVDSGPPALRQAAVDSAARSQFQADPESLTSSHRLVYRFVLDETTKCEHDDSYPRVKHEANLVIVTEQNIPMCDYGVVYSTIRFRSARCLYLWKCGSKTP
ncbi:MAG: energy transducer TonB, partial [Terracidiphilus sp.]